MSWQGTNPNEFMRQVIRAGDERVRKAAGDMLSGVIAASPVDTGAFRSNHRISINSPDTSISAIETQSGAINTGKSKIAAAKLGDMVYIQNNLPYARKLEFGSSRQAPSGVYAVTFAAVAERYRQ